MMTEAMKWVLMGDVSIVSLAFTFMFICEGVKSLRPSLAWQLVKDLPLIAKELKVDKQEDGTIKVKFGDT